MIFDRYLLKNLLWATIFTALSLACVIMLTQSLRFLELIIHSGASGLSFFALTLLAMPRFFEIILPIALMIGTVFTYNRMGADSEMIVMKSSGFSPLRLSRPALLLATLTMVLVFLIAAWLSPMALSKMQTMKNAIRAQYSNILFRDGVFNPIGKDLTVYIDRRTPDGDMEGLLIHDTREGKEHPVTILAQRGTISSEGSIQKILIYNGSRQEFNPETGSIDRLDFQRYSLDLPESGPIDERWREPDERTLLELLTPDEETQKNPGQLREFFIESQRRFISPFLPFAYTLVSLCCLLLGPADRRGLKWRIVVASAMVIVLQGLYLVAYNLAKDNTVGLVLMYVLVFVPVILGYYCLGPYSESFTGWFRKRTERFL